jgi:signal transduction histidine kinase/CheY-like chemotaxis protein
VTFRQLATTLGGIGPAQSETDAGVLTASRQVEEWHRMLLRWQTRATALVFVPYCTFGAIYYYGKPWLVAFAAASSLYMAFLALLPNLSFGARLHGYLAFCAVGASLCFLLVGPVGLPLLAVVGLASVALIYRGWKAVLGYCLPVALVYCAAAVVHTRSLLPFDAPQFDVGILKTWIAPCVTAILIGGLITISHHFIVQRMRRALVAEVGLRRDLEREVVAKTWAMAELASAQESLVHAERLKVVGQLAGGVAHDINNVLCAIVAEAELSKDTSAGEAVVSFSTQAAALTQRLLGLARSGVVVRRPIYLDDAVLDVVGSLGTGLPGAIKLTCDLERGRYCVEADPVEIQQAVLNLALNARDAMPEGGELTFRTSRVGDRVLLEVIDTGAGMSAEVRSRMFEPFFTTKGNGRGTGLGLYNVQRTVSELGGSVVVESALGEGTRFTVDLPACAQKPRERGRHGAALGNGETVLVVDDDIRVRAALVGVLAQAGYRVQEARDGHEALDLLDDGQASLLVSDVLMPGMSGGELLRRVRENHPSLPVLIYSGYAERDDVEPLLAQASTRFLRKPAPRGELLQEIAGLLAG